MAKSSKPPAPASKPAASKPVARTPVRNSPVPQAAPAARPPAAKPAAPQQGVRAAAPAKPAVPQPAAKSATPASPAAAAKPVTHELIARRAYEIWSSGHGGSDLDNWIRAERELRGM